MHVTVYILIKYTIMQVIVYIYIYIYIYVCVCATNEHTMLTFIYVLIATYLHAYLGSLIVSHRYGMTHARAHSGFRVLPGFDFKHSRATKTLGITLESSEDYSIELERK